MTAQRRQYLHLLPSSNSYILSLISVCGCCAQPTASLHYCSSPQNFSLYISCKRTYSVMSEKYISKPRNPTLLLVIWIKSTSHFQWYIWSSWFCFMLYLNNSCCKTVFGTSCQFTPNQISGFWENVLLNLEDHM